MRNVCSGDQDGGAEMVGVVCLAWGCGGIGAKGGCVVDEEAKNRAA